MPNPRLLAVITALSCLGAGSTAFAAYTLEQLREIERMVVSKDCGGLRIYLDTNPSLLQGVDPLAAELRSFVQGVDTGLIECLSLRPDVVDRQPSLTSSITTPY